MDGSKMIHLLSGWPIFRGENVSFREWNDLQFRSLLTSLEPPHLIACFGPMSGTAYVCFLFASSRVVVGFPWVCQFIKPNEPLVKSWWRCGTPSLTFAGVNGSTSSDFTEAQFWRVFSSFGMINLEMKPMESHGLLWSSEKYCDVQFSRSTTRNRDQLSETFKSENLWSLRNNFSKIRSGKLT